MLSRLIWTPAALGIALSISITYASFERILFQDVGDGRRASWEGISEA